MEERTENVDPELPGDDLATAHNGARVVIFDPENMHAWIVGRGIEVGTGGWR